VYHFCHALHFWPLAIPVYTCLCVYVFVCVCMCWGCGWSLAHHPSRSPALPLTPAAHQLINHSVEEPRLSIHPSPDRCLYFHIPSPFSEFRLSTCFLLSAYLSAVRTFCLSPSSPAFRSIFRICPGYQPAFIVFFVHFFSKPIFLSSTFPVSLCLHLGPIHSVIAILSLFICDCWEAVTVAAPK